MFGTAQRARGGTRRRGVKRFVNISTDKAADPTSVLGYTKRITERLTAAMPEHDRSARSSRCASATCSDRAARCSTSFRAQAAAGGPITVTHPRRHPLLHDRRGGGAGSRSMPGPSGDDGEVLVLDMGEPVSIRDVAERFANQSTPAARDRLHRPAPGREAPRGPYAATPSSISCRSPAEQTQNVPTRRRNGTVYVCSRRSQTPTAWRG